MRVRVRSGDASPALLGIFVTLIFFCFSVGVYIAMFTMGIWDFLVAGGGMFLVFALVFSMFDVIFIYYLVKPCKKYFAKLEEKKLTAYRDREIYLMTFKVFADGDGKNGVYYCYNYKDNDLEVGKNYFIYVKEFNWQIKKVGCEITQEEMKNQNEKISKIDKDYNSNQIGINLVFVAVFIIISAPLFLSILGIIFYPKYSYVYVPLIIMFTVILGIMYKTFRK